jgi:hypothetical protein
LSSSARGLGDNPRRGGCVNLSERYAHSCRKNRKPHENYVASMSQHEEIKPWRLLIMKPVFYFQPLRIMRKSSALFLFLIAAFLTGEAAFAGTASCEPLDKEKLISRCVKGGEDILCLWEGPSPWSSKLPSHFRLTLSGYNGHSGSVRWYDPSNADDRKEKFGYAMRELKHDCADDGGIVH